MFYLHIENSNWPDTILHEYLDMEHFMHVWSVCVCVCSKSWWKFSKFTYIDLYRWFFQEKLTFLNLENKGYQNLGSNLIYVNVEPKFFDLGKLAQNVKLLVYETQGSVTNASVGVPIVHRLNDGLHKLQQFC